MRALVDEAGQEIRDVLEAGCGDALENCIAALGWVTADAAGSASVALPADLDEGAHRVAVVDESGELVGWASVAVAAEEMVAVGDELASAGGQLGPVWIAA